MLIYGYQQSDPKIDRLYFSFGNVLESLIFQKYEFLANIFSQLIIIIITHQFSLKKIFSINIKS